MTSDTTGFSDVAMDDGNDRIFARRFDRDGAQKGSALYVGDNFGFDERHPDVGIDAAGNFAVSWGDSRNDSGDVFIKRFGSDG
ncbi:MAG: hypothetical protein GY762_05390, partial [Proteobacteria bacterium]|nr:hypothetical protein [Pseudomonadota bacterium]